MIIKRETPDDRKREERLLQVMAKHLGLSYKQNPNTNKYRLDGWFYHDQGGATYTKEDFINGMKGLGTLSYKARRELIPNSTKVFPMYKNGELYAALLEGVHAFYAKEPNDKPEYLTSTAKYTTLWILIEGEWKMSRIYSYDHQAPN